MTEVSCRALELHLRILEETGTSVSRFIQGLDVTEAQLRDPKARIRWNDFALLSDRLENLCGGQHELEEAGARLVETPGVAGIMKIAALFASPRNFYWAAHKWAGPTLFSVLRTELEILGPTALRFSVIVPEPYLPSTGFFCINGGTLRAAPRTLGMPDSVVISKIDGRRCDYLIEHPPSMTIFSRIRHAFLALFSATRAFNELRSQNDELHRQLRDLTEARRRAEEASRLKTQFIANVSHEIRTPMNGVIGMAEVLLGGTLAPDDRKHAEMIRTSADILMRVINDVLDFSKIEAGNLQIEMRESNLHATIEKAATFVGARAHEKGLEFECAIDQRVPQWARFDAARVHQVLLNLLENAVKFTSRGGVNLAVSLDGLTPNLSTIRFTVRDTGIGISDEARDRLFTPFVQQDGRMTRKYGGTGLGLAISRQLVELMGGEMGVETEIGRGSTFWFSIPCANAGAKRIAIPGMSSSPSIVALPDPALQRVSSPAFTPVLTPGMTPALTPGLASVLAPPLAPVPPAAPSAIPAAAIPAPPSAAAEPGTGSPPAQPAGPRKRLLVAEDNMVNRAVIVRHLERLGYSVDIAVNGREAVEAIERSHYDAVLMDLQMPEMDGFQATATIRMREEPSEHIPIIAVSAHSEAEFVTRALEVGMDAHVAKPIQRAQISEILHRMIGPPTEDLHDGGAQTLPTVIH